MKTISPVTRKVPAPGDTYVHQNGHTYTVICVARDDYLGQDLVIHKGHHDGRIWSRPLSNFLGQKDGMPRFRSTGGLVHDPIEPSVPVPRGCGCRMRLGLSDLRVRCGSYSDVLCTKRHLCNPCKGIVLTELDAILVARRPGPMA